MLQEHCLSQPWDIAGRRRCFDGGNRIEAVKLATQTLCTGGGACTHLALGRYLRSMHRHRGGTGHYHATLELEPRNNLAMTGVDILEN